MFFLFLNIFDSTQLPNAIKCFLIVVASNFCLNIRDEVFITVPDADPDHFPLSIDC